MDERGRERKWVGKFWKLQREAEERGGGDVWFFNAAGFTSWH